MAASVPELICIGELLADLTQTGFSAQGFPLYTAFPGGAPANVAVAAARLGADCGFVGVVGRDALGDFLCAQLRAGGVDTSGLCRSADVPTTAALVSVGAGGERDFAFLRHPGADTLLRAEDIDLAAIRQCRLLHFGSVSLTDEPSRSAVFTAVRAAREAGVTVSFDPNYRAALWTPEAAMPQLQQALGLCDLLKVSEEELLLLTGTTDPILGSQRLAERGSRLVLVTLGERGAFCRRGAQTCQVPAFSVPVADTNGAGDAFTGALLCRAVQEDLFAMPMAQLCRVLAFASAAAAVTVSRSGARMPTAQEVCRLLGVEI